MSDLTPEDVRRVARLCKLRLDETEVADAQRRLGAMLDRMTCLRGLDLDGVEPMTRAIDEPVVLREDEPGPTLTPDDLRAMAPRVFEAPGERVDEDGQAIDEVFIAVPRVLGDGGGA